MVQSFWNLRYRNLGFRPGFGNTTSNVQRFVGRERQPSAWAAARQPEYAYDVATQTVVMFGGIRRSRLSP
jgi:hypothetical protein